MRAFRFFIPGLAVLALLTLSACVTASSLGFLLPSPTPNLSGYRVHVVKEGETLSHLAVRYRSTIEQITALNADTYPELARDPSVLQAGWELRVPDPAAQALPTTPTVQPKADLSETARQIVDAINSSRAQRGLVLLRAHGTLARIAGDRSRDMIARNYFSHSDPTTAQEPLLRYLQANKFAYEFVGENIAEIRNDANWIPGALTIAARYSTSDLAQKFVEDWLNSPTHRENIFQPRFRRTGVGLAVSGDGRRIVATQVFAD